MEYNILNKVGKDNKDESVENQEVLNNKECVVQGEGDKGDNPYSGVEEALSKKDYHLAKKLVSELIEDCIQQGQVLNPELKEYILSDWYKAIETPHTQQDKSNTEKEGNNEGGRRNNRRDPSEVKPPQYKDIPAVVVGRNLPKRIINLAWGRGQEGFFKWNFRTPLPNYNDFLSITFDQQEPGHLMAVRSALPLEGNHNFTSNFFVEMTASLQISEEGEMSADLIVPETEEPQSYALANYLFKRRQLADLVAGDELLLRWIYKYNPKEQVFAWVVTKADCPRLDSAEALAVAETPQPEEEAKPELDKETAEPAEEPKAVQPEQIETHTLIINDIPLKNGKLICRCLTKDKEIIYFRKSLTTMEINRLDKLVITGVVEEAEFGRCFSKIKQIRLAKDEDFPETILRHSIKWLRKLENNIYLGEEPLTARKINNFRIKYLLQDNNDEDLEVLVEEIYLYAVHINDYEWTIASIKPKSHYIEVPTVEKASTTPKSIKHTKEKSDLQQPWQTRLGFITEVSQEAGRIEFVYGPQKKGFISLENCPIKELSQGDWLGLRMFDGEELMQEILFDDMVKIDPKKNLPNMHKFFYRIRRGVLWYSEQDHIFKLNNTAISNDVVLAMKKPLYKGYYKIEELLDYDTASNSFVWRIIKLDQFTYADDLGDIDENIYPYKFRQKTAFIKAVQSLETLSRLNGNKEEEEKPKAKSDKRNKPERAKKNKKKKCEKAIVSVPELGGANIVSFCPQKVSKQRPRKSLCLRRGRKGISRRK